jgi:hypothetical protein
VGRILDDDAEAEAICCLILTTSSGVTARATAMEPIEPDKIRGIRSDDEDDEEEVSSSLVALSAMV